MRAPEDHLRAELGDVMRELVGALGEEVEVMVIGAVCRDALHLQQGHESPLRATDDVDLALVYRTRGTRSVRDLGFDRVPGSAGAVRFSIAGRLVDLVPFGPGVEVPDGVVTMGSDGPLSVFGYQDVFDAARSIRLDDGVSVRFPTVAGFVLLKLKAWVDRSSWHAYKDAADLAVAMFWYAQSSRMTERLYRDGPELDLLIAADSDEAVAAAGLVVADAVGLLPSFRRAELAAVWPATPDDVARLARYMRNDALPGWPGAVGADADARRLAIASLVGEVVRGDFSREP